MKYFKKGGYKEGHNRTPNPNGVRRRQMLDMRRQKYFRFDLDDMLVEFEVGNNKNTIAATILNKMTSQSLDDALDYINRIKTSGSINEEKEEMLKRLLLRYTVWR